MTTDYWSHQPEPQSHLIIICRGRIRKRGIAKIGAGYLTRLVKSILWHVCFLWAPAYVLALGLAIALLISFGSGTLSHSLALLGVVGIVLACVGVSFWSYEKLSLAVQTANMPEDRKFLFRLALYFLPWLLFLFTLATPSLVMTRFG